MDANPDQPTPSDIADLLNQDLAGYQLLLEILTEERKLLVQRNFDAFVHLLNAKQDQLNTMSAQNQHRLKLLTAAGFSPDEPGMVNCLELLDEPDREAAQVTWTRVKQLIEDCGRQNDINARVAHRAQTTSRQILNILQGRETVIDLYGKSGDTTGTAGAAPITQA